MAISPTETKEASLAKYLFSYPLMTGENHVSYNKGLKRYIMGNYGFINEKEEPVDEPYHQTKLSDSVRQSSQLTIFEAPRPCGPSYIFHQNDNYQN